MKNMKQALVAHRGYNFSYPENTLLAIESALAVGAAYVEIDVQFTTDLKPVVVHDANLERLSGVSQNILDLELAQCDNLSVHEPKRFGNKFYPQKIPTLQQIVTLFSNYPGRHLIVEIKRASIRRYGIQPIIDVLIPVIAPIQQQCMIISFHSDMIQCLADSGGVKVGYVFEDWGDETFAIIARMQPHFLFTDYTSVPATIESLPQGGWQWGVYTIDDAQTAVCWFEKGVALVETNNIGHLITQPLLQHFLFNG